MVRAESSAPGRRAAARPLAAARPTLAGMPVRLQAPARPRGARARPGPRRAGRAPSRRRPSARPRPRPTPAPPPDDDRARGNGGLKTWQEVLIFAAGLILLGGIGFAIVGDARERTRKFSHHTRRGGRPPAIPHKHSQAGQAARPREGARREGAAAQEPLGRPDPSAVARGAARACRITEGERSRRPARRAPVPSSRSNRTTSVASAEPAVRRSHARRIDVPYPSDARDRRATQRASCPARRRSPCPARGPSPPGTRGRGARRPARRRARPGRACCGTRRR